MKNIEQNEKTNIQFIKVKKWIFVNKGLENSTNYLNKLRNLKINFSDNYSIYIVKKTKTKTVYFDVIGKKINSLWVKEKEFNTYTVPVSIKEDLHLFNSILKNIPITDKLYWKFYKKMVKSYKKLEDDYLNLSDEDIETLVKWDIFLSVFILKWYEILEINFLNWTDKNVIIPQIYLKTIRPIDLLLLKTNWQISEQDYQKYLPQVKELLKTQLTNEYYKIFLQIPNFFPFSHITQKELDFYAGKIKEYKANIPWIWKIVLKLDKPIISEEEYQEYSKKLSELKEKYLGETQQDILNLQEEIKFKSMNELIQAIREHKLKEFWQIKEEYWINKDKEKLKKNILNLVKKHYKPYNKLSNEEKRLVEKLIIWVEVNSK